VVDHRSKLAVFDRTIELNGVPVALVLVVTRMDRRVASSQLQGKVWVALEVHAAWTPLESHEGEHPASDLEHGDAVSKRVVLDRSGQAGA
jgi:hypothetical protein